MPLDPFFAERLRVHRRYLLGKAWHRVRDAVRGFLHPRDPGVRPIPGGTRAGLGRRPQSRPAPARPKRRRAARTPASARAKHRRAALAWDRTELETVGTPGPELRITEHHVPVPGFPEVRVRVYHPPQHERPVPGVLAFFGGAFRIGGIDYPTTDAAFRRRAHDAGVAIIAVDYALAPEHRYPTQVEQGYACLEWLIAHADELGIDAERIGIAGTSAGGSLAAALTLVNRDRARHPLRLQLLEVPVVDLTGRHLDLRATWALGIPALIALRELRSVAGTYLPRPAAAREPLASPIRAASHRGLPPAVILTAEYDPLRGHGDAYGAALRRDGVAASVVQYRGGTHDTALFTGALPLARRWHDDVVAALRSLHTLEPPSG